MNVQIFIPYANGDCSNGFKYDKPITRQEFVKQQTTEWKERRDILIIHNRHILFINVEHYYMT